MRARIAVAVMAALLVLYAVAVFQYALALLLSGSGVAIAMGIALLVLPVVGVVFLSLDVIFVARGQALVNQLADAGELNLPELPLKPSGRPDRAAADAAFPAFQAAVEAAPDDWKAWLRLGQAYDASGDRRRARWATRQAIRLQRVRATPSG
jgi:tetratricopeptide (TPR) repeat protein